MKSLLAILVILSSFSCTDNYSLILDGLSQNSVLLKDEIGDDLYFEYFELNLVEHSKKVEEYNKAINDFYTADKSIIDYLLKYKNDDKQFCNWIKVKNPYSSIVNNEDLLTKSKSALILIDNYLSNFNTKKIKTSSYFDNLSYEEFIVFYNNNKDLEVIELRKSYLNYLSKFR